MHFAQSQCAHHAVDVGAFFWKIEDRFPSSILLFRNVEM